MMSDSKNSALADLFWNLLPFVVCFVFLLILHSNIRSFDSDDAAFARVQEQSSLGEFLAQRYAGWSGRLSIEATMYLVRGLHLRWWRWLNSFVLTGLCFSLAYLLLGRRFWLQDHRQTARTIWLLTLGCGLINMQVLSSGMFWVTGSFNYLWPIAAGSASLIPVRLRLTDGPGRQPLTIWIARIGGMLAALYASLGNEQVALVLLGLMLAANVAVYAAERRVDGYLLLLMVVTGLGFAMLWAAPGNRIRFEQEIQTWYPEFHQLAPGQHLFIGLTWLLDKIINLNRFLLALLFALMAVLLGTTATKRGERAMGVLVAFLAAFLVVSSLQLDYLHPDLQAWLHEWVYAFKTLGDLSRAFGNLDRNSNFFLFLIPYLIWTPVLVATPYLLYRSSGETPVGAATSALVFCAAVASLVVVIFSPTMFASANRLAAVYSVMLLFVVANLYHTACKRIPFAVQLSVFLLAAANLLFQHWEWSRRYFIHW